MITTRGVEKEASVCTMVEFNSTVIHRLTGSTLAAESAPVDKRIYVRLLVEA